ncbi:Glutamate receptor ionotropic, kainate 2 [Araneus ventricosus]|uniref:Glutamate receptor ionotropic, kainate 2 n=1 Tax=Araneus ventricosus TaxID=182803 RepID=A0A4Y2SZA4_ARAVE|nr:Glutamate receptor ionotropic, kainate 2 [Araneus ventricosus]
MHFDVFLSTD